MSNTAGGQEIASSRSDTQGWIPKPAAAFAVRVVQVILPFLAGWLAIRALRPLFIGSGETGWLPFTLWLIQAIVVATAVSAAVARLVRRLTPLVSLFNMSLVFPDSVPSRFGLALRTGSIKKLLAEPELRLSSSAQAAAEQAVQLVSHLGKHEPLTRGHTERVRAYADVIGQQMGLSDEELNGLRWGALLHDIGKLSVPAEILNKPGKPTAEEWEILKGHPAAAIPILEPLYDWLGDWLLAAPQHHERFDGTGYPAGLSGRDISLAGRITAVADAYDVITSRRSYKEAKSAEFAREEMVRSAGSHFDPVVVRALLEAGVTQTAYGRRMGWILELPGIARALSTAGQAVATATVAVAVTAASAIVAPAPVEEVAAVDALAFEEPLIEEDSPLLDTTTPFEVPGVPSSAPATAEPLPAPTSPTSSPEAVESSSVVSSTSTVPTDVPEAASPAPSTTSTPDPVVTTNAPNTTTAPTTTTTTTTQAPATTTTTTPPETPDCAAARAGMTFLPGGDLRGCNLSNLVAPGLDLSGANLRGANLTGIDVSDFNFGGADLTGATLTNATFTRGNLAGAVLTDVVAARATFFEVGFQMSDLRRGNFANASFTGTSFDGADVRQASFSRASVVTTDFRSADLRGVDMAGLDLSAIDFENAVLGQIDFGGTNLTGARFFGATGVPARTVGANFAQTTCPDGTFGNVNCW